MKVALCVRPQALSHGTGTAVQLENTKKALESNHGISVEIVTNYQRLRERDFDICHLFGIVFENASEFIQAAKKIRAKVAFSTIFWNLGYTVAARSLLRLGILDYSDLTIGATMRFMKLRGRLTGSPHWFSQQFKRHLIEMITNSDVLLPNSLEEAYHLSKFTGIAEETIREKTHVVYNAATALDDATIQEIENLPSDFVLQVASLEPHKNQHSLIRALSSDKQIPIVFVGTRGNPFYYDILKKLADARGNVFFLDFLKQEALGPLYSKAILHALPSLRESPGLTSLEALRHGCRILVSDKRFCPIDTYFKDVATVVNPLDMKSIRKGILSEMETNRDRDSLKRHAAAFSWDIAAEQTYEAYLSIAA